MPLMAATPLELPRAIDTDAARGDADAAMPRYALRARR